METQRADIKADIPAAMDRRKSVDRKNGKALRCKGPFGYGRLTKLFADPGWLRDGTCDWAATTVQRPLVSIRALILF